MKRQGLAIVVLAVAAAGCTTGPVRTATGAAGAGAMPTYVGTTEPFASEAVYFVVTDRFVDGDPTNNHEAQGGDPWGTFDRPIVDPEGRRGNIGYLGGDFAGIAAHADTIAGMGFTAIWLTPIVDNPDEAFSGGVPVGAGFPADQGKTGYHGYWGVNFYRVDEHLESSNLSFADLARQLSDEHGLKTVLDVVCNHGSPSFTMPVDQPKFGELYDEHGHLVADHRNLHPTELDPNDPLHAFFHRETDIGELSNFDETNPAVLEYFVGAYLKWIGQGAAALRIDTIKHMPHPFWRAFSDRIHAVHPGLFMFAESWNYNAAEIAEHTWSRNGGISVLDFPGRQKMNDVFADGADYAEIVEYLHLDDGLYRNPYELMIFYDNHDMPRMAADADGFIDANNWLFTSRGIPVVYYGSETAFRAGAPEHGGNRDYYGAERVTQSAGHPVREALTAIAQIRRNSPALQRGLQVGLGFGRDSAAFLRVYQQDGVAQTALVLLNKGETPATITIDRFLSPGDWRDAATGQVVTVGAGDPTLAAQVPAHGVRVLLRDAPNTDRALAAELDRLQRAATSGDR